MAVAWSPNSQFYKKYLFQLMMMYKNRADVRAFLEILLSLFTVALFGVFAIKPTLVTIAGLVTEIRARQETINRMDTKIQALAEAQQLYEQKKEAIKLLENAIPPFPQVEDYIKQIELLAIDHAVSLEIVSTKSVPLLGEAVAQLEQAPTPVEGEETIVPLPGNASEIEFTLAISGDYPNLVAYVKDIENLRRPMFMDTLSFDSIALQTDEQIVLTMKGRLAFLP